MPLDPDAIAFAWPNRWTLEQMREWYGIDSDGRYRSEHLGEWPLLDKGLRNELSRDKTIFTIDPARQGGGSVIRSRWRHEIDGSMTLISMEELRHGR